MPTFEDRSAARIGRVNEIDRARRTASVGSWRDDGQAETASEAYDRYHAAATAIARRLLDGLETDGRYPGRVLTEPRHWGHVGDMAELERKLRDAADMYFGEGEYR